MAHLIVRTGNLGGCNGNLKRCADNLLSRMDEIAAFTNSLRACTGGLFAHTDDLIVHTGAVLSVSIGVHLWLNSNCEHHEPEFRHGHWRERVAGGTGRTPHFARRGNAPETRGP